MSNLVELLNMKVVAQQQGYLKMEMPVTDNVKQPFGYLHGGATMALGETACSIGSAHLLDVTKEIPVGLEMNANHIKSVQSGKVIATATLLHRGRMTHIWDVKITNEEGILITVMRGTIAVKQKNI
ncbi:PaaI family thioesterase [Staphylococcus agnetis]|uniref:PaaI family thioesterase n=1 Tax=Staphylococcus agnetis TaxID=985762 RepID=UPI0004E4652C|nr:PaaI family thioesterase [Staphylococcus agnetis]KFE41430.1 hypothetical protein SAGN_07903 [Staphylococcus agnetis]NJH65816.1 hotdog fold thioesterase [Staphylococcus agnetis]NJH98158.1 hotdog fold thioesterase [Staphylococcus agnetis]PTH48836.1 PaaI family thioesterase [Staphylococcus agnetis]PTH73741.1 PaaI family thioesterase [Staphylococcus agnetis]